MSCSTLNILELSASSPIIIQYNKILDLLSNNNLDKLTQAYEQLETELVNKYSAVPYSDMFELFMEKGINIVALHERAKAHSLSNYLYHIPLLGDFFRNRDKELINYKYNSYVRDRADLYALPLEIVIEVLSDIKQNKTSSTYNLAKTITHNYYHSHVPSSLFSDHQLQIPQLLRDLQSILPNDSKLNRNVVRLDKIIEINKILEINKIYQITPDSYKVLETKIEYTNKLIDRILKDTTPEY